jgi:hypothetical protein
MFKKIPTSIAILIILILAVAIGAGVWWYGEKNNQVEKNNQIMQPNQFTKNIEATCKNSGGAYIGGPPSGWMDNREMWIPCNCPEGTRWSFSPNFICEPEQKQQDLASDTNVSEWQTYKNTNQGFEISFPPVGKWGYDIRVDEKGEWPRFYTYFYLPQEENNISFSLKINLFGEVTPPFPKWPFCKQNKEAVFLNNKISQTIYSIYYSKTEITEEKECEPSLDSFLLNEHSIETRFCIDKKDLKTYPAEWVRGYEEYYYNCSKGGDLYHFSSHCEGKNWGGKEGRDKCLDNFNQILSTFRFIP